MISFLLAMCHVVAAETLDRDMSSQDRKKTGVYRLSDKEKSALQLWVDAHYEKRSAPVAQEGQKSMLSENLYNGHYIRLADGTLWNIHPSDVNAAQGWITPVDIAVTRSGDPNYPYKLTNTVSGTSLRARKATELPKAAPAAPAAPQK